MPNIARLREEIAQNMDFFQRTLSDHLTAQHGHYAVLKDRCVLGYFDDPLAADIFDSGGHRSAG